MRIQRSEKHCTTVAPGLERERERERERGREREGLRYGVNAVIKDPEKFCGEAEPAESMARGNRMPTLPEIKPLSIKKIPAILWITRSLVSGFDKELPSGENTKVGNFRRYWIRSGLLFDGSIMIES